MAKEKVKALWRLCFDDTEEFIDMYFRLRYCNETNISIQYGDEMISALQMLPYPMTFNGQLIPTSYISGACTHPDYRGKGVMRELLSLAFAQMVRNSIPLSTLIPAEPWLFDYYARMGYAPVFHYSEEKLSDRNIKPSTDIIVKKQTGDNESVYHYFNRKMSERPCCIQHTPTDFNVILADLGMSDGTLYIASREKEIAGVAFAYPNENGLMINELLTENKEIENALLYQIQDESRCNNITLITPPMHSHKQLTLGMARIIDAKAILQLYATLYPEDELSIKLTDEQLPMNNGYYHLCNGRCMVNREYLSGKHIELTIGKLCEKVFSPLQPYMSLMLN